MRRFFELLYVAMSAVVGTVLALVFGTLSYLSSQTAQGMLASLLLAGFFLLYTIDGVHEAKTGRWLFPWLMRPYPWTNSPALRLAIITPLFCLICYLLLYAALVHTNGERPEWLEP